MLIFMKEPVMITNNGGFDQQLLAEHIERLRGLLHDLEEIQAGRFPTDEQLANAPLITAWKLHQRWSTCLTGSIMAHPLLGFTSPGAITSQLWVIDEKQGYARTLSRYYKLGERAKSL